MFSLFKRKPKVVHLNEKFNNITIDIATNEIVSQNPMLEKMIRLMLQTSVIDLFWLIDKMCVDYNLVHRFMAEKNELMKLYDVKADQIINLKSGNGEGGIVQPGQPKTPNFN